MCKADGGCTDIHNLFQVEVVLFIGEGATQSPPVLMAGYPQHGVLLSIEEESFACHDFILANPQGLNNFVYHASILHET